MPPAPGMAPIITPVTEERIIIQIRFFNSLKFEYIFLICCLTFFRCSSFSNCSNISATPKRPIIAVINSTPVNNSARLNVKRGWPTMGSDPIVAIKSPNKAEIIPFKKEPSTI